MILLISDNKGMLEDTGGTDDILQLQGNTEIGKKWPIKSKKSCFIKPFVLNY